MNNLRIYALITIFSISYSALAQINKPGLSPRVEVTQKIGLATVKLDYGRPSMKGREIFGSLIPYGKVWRTGANSSTKISFDRDVVIKNKTIPKGEYALYSIPDEKEWTIIIHGNNKLWGAGNYKEENDFARFQFPIQKLTESQKTLSIDFENLNANGGDLTIAWENTKVVVPIFIDTDELIFKEIEEKLINATGEISAATYFDAAQFYYEKEKELNKAVEWFDKAINLRPNAFWYVYYRAEIAYKLNDKKTAKTMAEKSLQMAKASPAGDFGYIAKNELLLKSIKTE